MSRFYASLVFSLFAALVLCSCGKPDYEEISRKIENRRQLDSDDYDAMIDYVEAASQAQLPKLREARTFEDVENIDEEMSKSYPFTDLFITAMFRDYTRLDDEQRLKLADIRKNTQKALEK